MNISDAKKYAAKLFHDQLPFAATNDQNALINNLFDFIFDIEVRRLFLIKGYAGTGKTSMMGVLIKILPHLKLKYVLLAPTGRAAKVLGGYAGKPAQTIHRKIYRKEQSANGSMVFARMPNLHTKTIFIVDEASMISGVNDVKSGSFSSSNLLSDLIEYVYNGQGCHLLLIGDEAQLPPVHSDQSPALSKDFLTEQFYLKVSESILTEVVRQNLESGILYNATNLRNLMEDVDFPSIETIQFDDVQQVPGRELLEILETAYDEFGQKNTMVICRSNKRANLYNNNIRARILWQDSEISEGDQLMVVKNNYFWLTDQSTAGFIANGDIIEITRIIQHKEIYGSRFVRVEVKMLDYPQQPEFETMLLLDTLSSETPALPREELKRLFYAIAEDYTHENNKRKRNSLIAKDPYFNALQVKFAYAVTCHKSQGGQWPAVFIDQGYFTDEMLDEGYLRWVYTAITRASEKVYLINFQPSFYHESSLESDS